MRLEYTYSFAEYRAINQARQHHRKFFRLRNWLFWGVVIANVAVSLRYIYIVFQNQLSFSWLIFANLAIAILVVAYRYIFLRYWNYRYYKMQMLQGKKIQLHVREQGIETVSDNITGHYNWKGFVGADEELKHFVLWVNKVQAICIPKRSFKDSEQVDKFRKIIAKNIDNRKLQA